MYPKRILIFNLCATGFTGVVTFKNADDVRKVVEVVPLNRMLLGTKTSPNIRFNHRIGNPAMLCRN